MWSNFSRFGEKEKKKLWADLINIISDRKINQKRLFCLYQ